MDQNSTKRNNSLQGTPSSKTPSTSSVNLGSSPFKKKDDIAVDNNNMNENHSLRDDRENNDNNIGNNDNSNVFILLNQNVVLPIKNFIASHFLSNRRHDERYDNNTDSFQNENIFWRIINLIFSFFDECTILSKIQKKLLWYLSIYSEHRNSFLSKYGKSLITISRINPLTHILASLVTLSMLVSVLSATHTLTIFSFHAIFMSFGVILFLTEGTVAQRNQSFLNTFGVIMGGSNKIKLQNIHRAFQVVSFAFVILGLFFIISNKVTHSKTLLPRSIHAVFGLLFFTSMLVQCMYGMEKLAVFRVNGSNGRGGALRIHRWHGMVGLVTFDLGFFAILTGAFKFLPFTFTTAILDLSIIFLWALVQIQMISRGNDGDLNFEVQMASLDKSSSVTGSPQRKREKNDDASRSPSKIYGGLNVECKGGDYDPMQTGGLLDESL